MAGTISMIRPVFVAAALLAAWANPWIDDAARGADGVLRVKAVDEETGEPLAVRMELRDARGRPVRVRPSGAVAQGPNLFFEAEATLELRRGAYTFFVEAGPEYLTRQGSFTIDRGAEDEAEVPLSRRVEMGKEGWYAGDLDVQLPLAELPLMMEARGIDFAAVAATVNDEGRCRKLKGSDRGDEGKGVGRDGEPLLFGPWATLDARRGGMLLAIGADPPVDVCQWKVNEPMLASAAAASEAGGLAVAVSPSSWELPVWIAAGKLDAVAIITRDSQMNAALEKQRPGRPRDETFFPGKVGNGRYVESIYHHLLNCGLQIPPAAGSGVGAGPGAKQLAEPIGANRVYVHCDEKLTRETWLEGLRAGRVVVTNGPLLRTSVEGEPPGHTFAVEKGQRREVQIALNLAFYEQHQVEYLEIIQNGRAIHQVRLDEFAKTGGRLPPVEFEDSGWFLVRAVTNNQNVYQFASTGPYYVQSNYEPRISKASVEYFLQWLDDAAEEFADDEAMLRELAEARPFWERLLERANAD
jgi:hypothetical protein